MYPRGWEMGLNMKGRRQVLKEGHMIDNREWRRAQVGFTAECLCLNMPQEKFMVRVININESGLCFAALSSVQPCHKMSMTFDLKGEGTVSLEVKIVWSGYFEKPGEYRTGVKITQAAPEDHEKFLRYYYLTLATFTQKNQGF
jgi:hypothetical protein